MDTMTIRVKGHCFSCEEDKHIRVDTLLCYECERKAIKWAAEQMKLEKFKRKLAETTTATDRVGG